MVHVILMERNVVRVMIIHIINRQRLCRLNTAKLKAVIALFMTKVTKNGARDWKELTVMLTDDDGIRRIKRQFFDIDCVTDVISFALNPQPADGGQKTAEIVVNAERACLEGKKRSGVEHEFALYLAHGCDHLGGHDDRTIRTRAKMRRRELNWLKEAEKLNLLSGLVSPAINRSIIISL